MATLGTRSGRDNYTIEKLSQNYVICIVYSSGPGVEPCELAARRYPPLGFLACHTSWLLQLLLL